MDNVHPIFKPILAAVAPNPALLADVEVVRAAIYDVIDAKDEDGIPWGAGFDHPFESIANDARVRFCDAVEKRMRELQNPPFNLGIKLENFCDHHKRRRLPLPSGSMCPDCERARAE